MKNLASLLRRAALTVAGALALGACSRSQYAFLPQAPAYLGAAPVATAPRPAAPVAAATPAPATEAAPVANAPEAAAVPAAKPAATTPAKVVAKATPAPTTTPETPAAVPKAPAKLSLAQRVALKQVTKKLDKLAAKAPLLQKRDATAGTQRLDQGLRTALVVLLIGVIVAAFGGVSNIFGILGGILIIVGLVLLLLYLLDQA